MTDSNQDFANGVKAIQGSKVPAAEEFRIMARLNRMKMTQEVVEWVWRLEEALEERAQSRSIDANGEHVKRIQFLEREKDEVRSKLARVEAELATAKQHVDEDMQLLSGEIARRTKAEAEVQRLQEEIKRLKAPVSDEERVSFASVLNAQSLCFDGHNNVCVFRPEAVDGIIAARAEPEKGEPQP